MQSDPAFDWNSKCDRALGSGDHLALTQIEKFAEDQECLQKTMNLLHGNLSQRGCTMLMTQLKKYICKYWHSEEEICQQFKPLILQYMFSNLERDEATLNQMAMVVVEIAVFEWPQNWDDFTQIISQPEQDILPMMQSLKIISMLAAKLNECSENVGITGPRLSIMNAAFLEQADAVLNLLLAALGKNFDNMEQLIPLYQAALQTLDEICSRVDCSYIFKSNILVEILNKSKQPGLESLYPSAVKVIAEVISIGYMDEDETPLLIGIFQEIATFLSENFTEDLYNLPWIEGLLCITIPHMFEQYSDTLETAENQEYLRPVIQVIVGLTRIIAEKVSEGDDSSRETFEKCVDFWYKTSQRMMTYLRSTAEETAYMVYRDFIPELLEIFIRYIVEPIQVNLNDDNSLELESQMKWGDLYSMMKQTIGYLARMEPRLTIQNLNLIMEALSQDFDVSLYQKLCWAGGAVVQVLNEQSDKTFVDNMYTQVAQIFEPLKDVIRSNDFKEEGEEAIAIIQTCCAYAFLCSQGEKFYVYDKELLETVVQNLLVMFEARSPKLQMVAIECFSILSNSKIKSSFIERSSEGTSLAEYLINACQGYIPALPPSSAATLVSVISQMAKYLHSEQTDTITPILQVVYQILQDAIKSLDLQNDQSIINLMNACQISSAASSLGSNFFNAFSGSASELFSIYQASCQSILEIIQASGHLETDQEAQRKCRIFQSLQKSTSQIISSILCLSPTGETANENVMQPFVAMCEFYVQSNDIVKSPSFFDVASSIARKFPQQFLSIFETFYNYVYGPTINMICNDFTSNYHFRLPLFKMMRTIINALPTLFMSLPFNQSCGLFDNMIQIGCNHPTHEVSEVAHDIVRDMIFFARTKCSKEFSHEFWVNYLREKFMEIIRIATDTIHMFCINKQAMIISEIFKFDEAKQDIDFLFEQLSSHFTSVQPENMMDILHGFVNDKTVDALNDLMILMRHISRINALTAERRQERLEMIKKEADKAMDIQN